MEETTQKPQGKGLAITGFIISLVGFVFVWFISFGTHVAAMAALGGKGYIMGFFIMGVMSGFWLALSLAGTILSFMGMKKLGVTGGKKGLAMTGLILGAIAVLLCAWLLYGITQVQGALDASSQFNDAIQQLNDGLQ